MNSKNEVFFRAYSTEERKRVWYLLNCTFLDKPNAKEVWKMCGRECRTQDCDKRATDIHYKRPKPTNSGSGFSVYCRECHFNLHYPDEEYAEYEKQYPSTTDSKLP